jgi:hypothetical protein
MTKSKASRFDRCVSFLYLWEIRNVNIIVCFIFIFILHTNDCGMLHATCYMVPLG